MLACYSRSHILLINEENGTLNFLGKVLITKWEDVAYNIDAIDLALHFFERKSMRLCYSCT